jgi:transposase
VRQLNFDPLSVKSGSTSSREDEGVLNVEDWAEIRRLHRAERLPIKMIARTLGVSRNTVRAALASDGPPGYARRSAGSLADEVEPRIRELLAV